MQRQLSKIKKLKNKLKNPPLNPIKTENSYTSTKSKLEKATKLKYLLKHNFSVNKKIQKRT